MKLNEGQTFWNVTVDGPVGSIPFVRNVDNAADVLVVGGGMSGTLTAYALCEAGLSVILIDRGFPGLGSTAANTGLLQYPSDMSLHESIAEHGRDAAVLFYQASFEGLQTIKRIAAKLPDKADLIERDSVCFASNRRDAASVRAEAKALKKHGFDAVYLSGRELKKRFGIDKPNAFMTKKDSQINPYKFVHGLLQILLKQHAFRAYHATEYLSQTDRADPGCVQVRTNRGLLYGRHVVMATGYARDAGSAPIARKAKRVRSYAIVSEPVAAASFWPEKVMIWETARPYIYIRHVEGNRILVGGLDDDVARAPSPRQVRSKARQLEGRFRDIFPYVPLKTAYAYGGLFGETTDGLPFIGRHPKLANTYCLYGYGGNGTVYSSIGACLIRDLILTKTNAYESIFALDSARLSRR